VIQQGDFTYGLEKNIPIFTNTRPHDYLKGKRIILPGYGFHTAFVLDGDHYDIESVEDLDYLLNRTSIILVSKQLIINRLCNFIFRF
jgi:hypothetical protein